MNVKPAPGINLTATDKSNIFKLVNNKKFADHMLYLHDRWQDERKYEDWSDYEDSIRKAVADIVGDGLVIKKVTKRPIGLILNLGLLEARIYLKVKPKEFYLHTTVGYKS